MLSGCGSWPLADRLAADLELFLPCDFKTTPGRLVPTVRFCDEESGRSINLLDHPVLNDEAQSESVFILEFEMAVRPLDSQLRVRQPEMTGGDRLEIVCVMRLLVRKHRENHRLDL